MSRRKERKDVVWKVVDVWVGRVDLESVTHGMGTRRAGGESKD